MFFLKKLIVLLLMTSTATKAMDKDTQQSTASNELTQCRAKCPSKIQGDFASDGPHYACMDNCAIDEYWRLKVVSDADIQKKAEEAGARGAQRAIHQHMLWRILFSR